MAYLLLLISTVWVGFRTALVRTPWQGYQIAALGAFVGEMAEGFIIDTDHWRHFFLILGIVRGLAAATRTAQRAPHLQRRPHSLKRLIYLLAEQDRLMLGAARHMDDLAILEADRAADLEQVIGAVGHRRFRLLHRLDARVADGVLEGVTGAVGRRRIIQVEVRVH